VKYDWPYIRLCLGRIRRVYIFLTKTTNENNDYYGFGRNGRPLKELRHFYKIFIFFYKIDYDRVLQFE